MSSKPRQQRSKPPGGKRRRAARPGPRRALLWLGLGLVLVSVATAFVALWLWGREGGSAEAPGYRRLVLESSDPGEVAALLEREGLISDVDAFRWYQRTFMGSALFEPGPHLVPTSATPQQLVHLLARHRSRPVQKVLLPEGLDLFGVAERLERLGICARGDFETAALARDPAQAEIGAPSFEGYLYPATYELRLNTPAEDVRRKLVDEARRRLRAAFDEAPAGMRALQAEFGFDEHDVVVLASMIEKETAARDEAGTIASVFLNRLRSETFRPRAMLQSDPTAGYGCKLPDAPPSCAGFVGRITPELLRDPANRYNTYKHPSLPPGPVASPSAEVVRAVLTAPKTEYFYFFAGKGGRHTFSRSFDEHRAAVRGE